MYAMNIVRRAPVLIRLLSITILFILLFLGCHSSDNNIGWVEITGPTNDDIYELFEYQETLNINGEAFPVASTTRQQCYCPDPSFITCILFGMWICGEEYTVENGATIYIVNRTMGARGLVMSHGNSWNGAVPIQTGENIIDVKAVDDEGNHGVDTLKVITKYDPSGLPHWIRILGTEEIERGAGLAIDANSNSYITGHTSGNLSGTGSAGGSDIFIAKYDISGNQLWLKQFGTTGQESGMDISVDLNGSSYVTGSTSGDLDGTGNAGADDIFIAKYDSSGNQLWLKQFEGNTSETNSQDIAVDVNGNSYITGKAVGSMVCPQGLLSSNGVFITKLDTFGNLLWLKKLCTETIEMGGDIAVDANGNCYITGYLILPSPSRNYNTFITKYDTYGNQLWLNSFGMNDVDMGTDIAVNQGGSIDVVGWTYDEIRTLGDVVDDALFIAKYDSSGQQISINQFYAPNRNSGQVNKIAIDESGSSWVMSSIYSNASRNDVYIMRLYP